MSVGGKKKEEKQQLKKAEKDVDDTETVPIDFKSPSSALAGYNSDCDYHSSGDDSGDDLQQQVINERKKKCKSGGFQSMGLSSGIFRSVIDTFA